MQWQTYPSIARPAANCYNMSIRARMYLCAYVPVCVRRSNARVHAINAISIYIYICICITLALALATTAASESVLSACAA